ncbi:MAG: AAA family ATPase [Anaerolineales bacterium]|nr:AAA family ATPase [Anaerolineales bacterium]
MRLVNLSIRNFRGIQELNWDIKGNMVCLIGPGDSTKSTILLALEYLFSLTWNLAITDVDFHGMNINKPIEITAVITEFPQPRTSEKSLLSEDKFGLYLGFWDSKNKRLFEIQDNKDFQKALQIRLKIDRDLEPEWQVVSLQNNGKEPQTLSVSDRRQLGVASIGNYGDADLAWGRNSALSRLTQREDLTQIPTLLANAERELLQALKDVDFSALTQAVENTKTIAESLGVESQSELRPGMNPMKFSLKQGAISLFDGDLPLLLRGAGSRRLMTMAVHKASVPDGAVILVDEIENSLEPYRIRHLIRQLRPKSSDKHQVIFTTHSPTAVVECDANELYTVHARNGIVSISCVGADFQDVVRSVPEAFLSKKVIICEGKTEAGFLIGLDEHYWKVKHKESTSPFKFQTMAEAGAAPIESPKSGGSNSPKYAVALAQLGYLVAYLGDSDRDLTPSMNDMKAEGVKEVFLWEGKLEIERRLCLDLPWEGLKQLITLAAELQGSEESVWDTIFKILETSGYRFEKVRDIDSLREQVEEPNLRECIGKAADSKSWFKRMDKGKALGELVAKYLDQMQNTSAAKTLCELEKWCYGG